MFMSTRSITGAQCDCEEKHQMHQMHVFFLLTRSFVFAHILTVCMHRGWAASYAFDGPTVRLGGSTTRDITTVVLLYRS